VGRDSQFEKRWLNGFPGSGWIADLKKKEKGQGAGYASTLTFL